MCFATAPAQMVTTKVAVFLVSKINESTLVVRSNKVARPKG